MVLKHSEFHWLIIIGKNNLVATLHKIEGKRRRGRQRMIEPDILECEVKWVLGSIMMNKASGGDRITVELFQILKDDADEC